MHACILGELDKEGNEKVLHHSIPLINIYVYICLFLQYIFYAFMYIHIYIYIQYEIIAKFFN